MPGKPPLSTAWRSSTDKAPPQLYSRRAETDDTLNPKGRFTRPPDRHSRTAPSLNGTERLSLVGRKFARVDDPGSAQTGAPSRLPGWTSLFLLFVHPAVHCRPRCDLRATILLAEWESLRQPPQDLSASYLYSLASA